MHFLGTDVPPDNICNPLSLVGFSMHTAESKIYLRIGKAWQIVKYIHPKEPHVRIARTETGNHRTETGDQPQAPK